MTTSTLPVLTPADPGYADEIAGYNRLVRHRPRTVVPARSADDVAAAVRLAAESGRSLGVQATGHGPSVPADGVLISTRRMRDVTVDPDARTVRVGAGVRGRDAVAALVPHGLAPLGGSSADVGVVGYHLGGGLPLLGRTFGYAADRVRSLDVVTADGRTRTVAPDTDPDLFRALLGARGAFAAVTALTTGAVPLTEVAGGGLRFTGEAIPAAVAAYLEWTRDLPDATNTSLLLMRMPDLPLIPEPLRGRPVAHVRVAHVGPLADADALLAPLRAAAPATLDAVGVLPVSELASIHGEPPGPVVFESRNSLAGPLDADAAAVLTEHADAGFLVELRHLGGALCPDPRSRALVGRRDAEFVVYTGTALPGPGDRPEAARAQARLHDGLAPWGVGGVTPAFLAGEHVTAAELASAYRPGDVERLARVKAEHDPENLFRISQAGATGLLTTADRPRAAGRPG